jgi:hypothetical protein
LIKFKWLFNGQILDFFIRLHFYQVLPSLGLPLSQGLLDVRLFEVTNDVGGCQHAITSQDIGEYICIATSNGTADAIVLIQ